MSLSAEQQRRIADLVALSPTKNSELQDRWGLDSGSAVHQYLETELKDYYYRDENSLIRATPAATAVLDDAGVSTESTTVAVDPLAADILSVLPSPNERSQSVVAVLHAVQSATDRDPSVESVRTRLTRLHDRGLIEVISRLVPTYRLKADLNTIELELTDQ